MAAKQNKIRFTASGSWTCPAGVTSVTVQGCGGGGGGGGGESGQDGFTRTQCAGSGGGGAIFSRLTVAVTPGTVYTVTIGAGGAGGAKAVSTASNGTDGGDTTFGSLATFIGASHGRGGDRSGSRFTGGGTPVRGYRRLYKLDTDNLGTLLFTRFWGQIPGSGGNGMDMTGFASGFDGDPSFTQLAGISIGSGVGGAAGGDGSTSGSAANGHGAGGGGPSDFPGSVGGAGGNGGNAAPGSNTSGGNATDGSVGTGFGAGGGGGGAGGSKNGSGTAGTGGDGAAGSNGFLEVIWYE